MTPTQAPARPAGADALVRAFKSEHDFWHGEWREHAYSCRQCLSGRHCRTGNYLADMADDYGKKWRLAEERLGKEATTDTTTQAGTADDRRGAGHPASRPPRRGPSTLTTDNEEPS
jgi:hypothetical protein